MLHMYWHMSIDANEFMKREARFQVNHANQVRLVLCAMCHFNAYADNAVN